MLVLGRDAIVFQAEPALRPIGALLSLARFRHRRNEFRTPPPMPRGLIERLTIIVKRMMARRLFIR